MSVTYFCQKILSNLLEGYVIIYESSTRLQVLILVLDTDEIQDTWNFPKSAILESKNRKGKNYPWQVLMKISPSAIKWGEWDMPGKT